MKTFEIDKAFEIVSGNFVSNDISVFSIVRDEIYFLPALLDHYRKLGYGQFVFMDDNSKDGSFEFLCAQNDCVVLRSPYKFGDKIRLAGSKKGYVNRAGTFLKDLIQKTLFDNKYITYIDADEFLILPSDFSTISEFVHYLKEHNIEAVHASSIEFYPETIKHIMSGFTPASFNELVTEYAYFDNTRLLELTASDKHREVGKIVGKSASTRLFSREEIKDLRMPWANLPQTILRWFPTETATSHVIKTPIMFRTSHTEMAGSHYANVPATAKVSVAMAHFVFTSNLPAKIANSLAWKSHARGATKYVSYSKLLKAMKNGNGSFLGPQSERFVDVRQLEDTGLIVKPS